MASCVDLRRLCTETYRSDTRRNRRFEGGCFVWRSDDRAAATSSAHWCVAMRSTVCVIRDDSAWENQPPGPASRRSLPLVLRLVEAPASVPPLRWGCPVDVADSFDGNALELLLGQVMPFYNGRCRAGVAVRRSAMDCGLYGIPARHSTISARPWRHSKTRPMRQALGSAHPTTSCMSSLRAQAGTLVRNTKPHPLAETAPAHAHIPVVHV